MKNIEALFANVCEYDGKLWFYDDFQKQYVMQIIILMKCTWK